ncbi:MAG: RHS repeat-associated core domain-containing protein [Bacteroidota bacterium]
MAEGFNVARTLVPQDLVSVSSFGLGWFSTYDYSFKFYPEGGVVTETVEGQTQAITIDQLLLFDPVTEQVIGMRKSNEVGNEGVYKELREAENQNSDLYPTGRFFKDMVVDGAVGEDRLNDLIPSIQSQEPAVIKYAILTRRNGWKYKLQIIDLNSDDTDSTVKAAGRLVEMTDPSGFTTTITYKYSHDPDAAVTHAAIQVDPTLQFQIDTVTDHYGNTAVYTYNPTQQSSQWVVSQINVNGGHGQGGETLDYTYSSDERLATVTRNGVLTSSYSYMYDQKWNCNKISTEEVTSRAKNRKDSIFLSADSVVWNDDLVNQFAYRLLGRQDGHGDRYMTVNRSPSDSNLFRIEYHHLLIDWSVGSYYQYYTDWIYHSTQTGFYGYDNLTPEMTYEHHPDVTAEEILAGEPPYAVDKYGYKTKLSYDDNHNVVIITHPDGAQDSNDDYFGAGATFEKFEYNEISQLVMYRDREGYMTLYEYDGGNVTRISKGLVDSNQSDDPSATSFNTANPPNPADGKATDTILDYYPSGLLKSTVMCDYGTSPDALHETTYTYTNSNTGYPHTMTLPKPEGASADPVVTWTFGSNRPDSITDEEGKQISYVYDEVDRIKQITYQDGTEQYLYDDTLRRDYTKDRNGIVSFSEYDVAGKLKKTIQAYGTDADLFDTTDIAVNVLGLKQSATGYFYDPRKIVPYQTTNNGRSVWHYYDYRDRKTMDLRRIDFAGTKIRASMMEYSAKNRPFKESELLVSNGSYQRDSYHGYSRDNTLVRIIQCRSDQISFANNDQVIDAKRFGASVADLQTPDPEYSIVDRVVDLRGVTKYTVDERDIYTEYKTDSLGRVTKQIAGLQRDNEDPLSFIDTFKMESETEYDFRSNKVETTDPLGNVSTWTYDDAGNAKSRVVASGENYAMSWSYTFDRKGRKKTETLPVRSGVTTSSTNTHYYSDCCSRVTGYQDAIDGGRVTIMNSGGQTVYEAGVVGGTGGFDFDDGDYFNIGLPDKLSEVTRSYGTDGRIQFQTRWIDKIDSVISPTDPPIAGVNSTRKGVTTQYAYFNQLPRRTPGTEYTQTLNRVTSAGTFDIVLNASFQELNTQGIKFGYKSTASANIVVSPDEKTYTYTISDVLGRPIMSGTNYGPAGNGIANAPIDWTITNYDGIDTVSAVPAGTIPVEVVTRQDFQGVETKSMTNGFGRVLQTVSSEDGVLYTTRSKYNVAGELLEHEDGNGNVRTYKYDVLGRQEEMTVDMATAADLVTKTEYFPSTGLVSKRIDAKGQSVTYVAGDYDVMGRLTSETDRLGEVTTKKYDNAGNLEYIIDAEGHKTSYEYDVLGRKLMTRFQGVGSAEGKKQRMGYDPLGRVQFMQTYGPNEDETSDTEGIRKEFVYEHSGVIDKTIFTGFRGSTTTTFEHDFDYDDFLRKTYSINQHDNVSVDYGYNDRGQLEFEELDYDTDSATNPEFKTSYTYDYAGRVETIQYPSADLNPGKIVAYDYRDRGYLKTVTWDGLLIETRTYDGGGRMTNVDRVSVDETRVYDEANRLVSILNEVPSNSNSAAQVGQLDYAYDANGNKTSESWAPSVGPAAMSDWNFVIPSTDYDAEDRFLSFNRTGNSLASNLSFDRSAPGTAGTIGNIQNITGTGPGLLGSRTFNETYELRVINEPESPQPVGGWTQTYNEEGQVTQTHNGHNLTWDESGRLSEINIGGSTDQYSYGYDCEGRRVWKKKVGENTFTVFANGGPVCISEITVDTSGPQDMAEIDKQLIYGVTIDELVAVDLPSTVSRPVAKKLGVTRNQQWSVMSVYDLTSGIVEQRYNYDVFGERYLVNADGTYTPSSSDPLGISIGYTSRRHDDESGLMYFRARFYDSTTGVFVSQDPLEYVDGYSLYRGYFAGVGIDPSGLQVRPADDLQNCTSGTLEPFQLYFGAGPFRFPTPVGVPINVEVWAELTGKLKHTECEKCCGNRLGKYVTTELSARGGLTGAVTFGFVVGTEHNPNTRRRDRVGYYGWIGVRGKVKSSFTVGASFVSEDCDTECATFKLCASPELSGRLSVGGSVSVYAGPFRGTAEVEGYGQVSIGADICFGCKYCPGSGPSCSLEEFTTKRIRAELGYRFCFGWCIERSWSTVWNL